jgi:hypothetical protein
VSIRFRQVRCLPSWLQGTHPTASAKHLQVYLDEFVFRHNRRHTPMAGHCTQTANGCGFVIR